MSIKYNNQTVTEVIYIKNGVVQPTVTTIVYKKGMSTNTIYLSAAEIPSIVLSDNGTTWQTISVVNNDDSIADLYLKSQSDPDYVKIGTVASGGQIEVEFTNLTENTDYIYYAQARVSNKKDSPLKFAKFTTARSGVTDYNIFGVTVSENLWYDHSGIGNIGSLTYTKVPSSNVPIPKFKVRVSTDMYFSIYTETIVDLMFLSETKTVDKNSEWFDYGFSLDDITVDDWNYRNIYIKIVPNIDYVTNEPYIIIKDFTMDGIPSYADILNLSFRLNNIKYYNNTTDGNIYFYLDYVDVECDYMYEL